MTCRCVAPVDVMLYHDPNSPEGREARRYFDRKGVRIEDMDASRDPQAQDEMQRLSGQTVRPVIVVDGQVVVGYDPEVLDVIVPSRF